MAKKKYWRIVSNWGVDLGTYRGATRADALNAMAKDAGYTDAEDATKVGGKFEGAVLEVPAPKVPMEAQLQETHGVPRDNPVRRVPGGFKAGSHPKVYKTRGGADRRARASSVAPRTRSKKENPSTPPSYKEAHWGLEPTSTQRLDVPDYRRNKRIVGLGKLVGIVYLTEKGGDGELVEYVHRFKKTLPVLGYGDRTGRLFICGGMYKVTKRGIEG